MKHPSKYSAHFTQQLAQRAAVMRALPTASERALWSALAAGALGTHFRRQVVLGRYIADFFAPAAGLIVEVDGRWHQGRADADARRDRALARLRLTVLRLPAELVLGNLAEALRRVKAALLAAGCGG